MLPLDVTEVLDHRDGQATPTAAIVSLLDNQPEATDPSAGILGARAIAEEFNEKNRIGEETRGLGGFLCSWDLYR